jgi:hypothetical protein
MAKRLTKTQKKNLLNSIMKKSEKLTFTYAGDELFSLKELNEIHRICRRAMNKIK